MKEKAKTKKTGMVLLCVVLVSAMLVVTVFAGTAVIGRGLSWFSGVESSWLIHHGAVPSTYMGCEEHYEDGFMDYTDYCKYFYTGEEDGVFAIHDLYRRVETDDIETIKGYFEHCGRLMEGQERGTEFDFESSCISAGDYVYMDTREDEKRLETEKGTLHYEKYDCYSVYLYDREDHILYYVHNNM